MFPVRPKPQPFFFGGGEVGFGVGFGGGGGVFPGAVGRLSLPFPEDIPGFLLGKPPFPFAIVLKFKL